VALSHAIKRAWLLISDRKRRLIVVKKTSRKNQQIVLSLHLE
jgi:hypothetical protein